MQNWQLTKREYLSQKYSYMLERVTNPNKVAMGRNNLGVAICGREDFIEFGLNDENFNRLWRSYKRSKGGRKKAPSVMRQVPQAGFILNNIIFTTASEYSGYRLPKDLVVIQDEVTGRVKTFTNTRKAANFLGHKNVIKVTRPAFTSLKNSKRYVNLTVVD